MQGVGFLIDWGGWCGKKSLELQNKTKQKNLYMTFTFSFVNTGTKIAFPGKGGDFSR